MKKYNFQHNFVEDVIKAAHGIVPSVIFTIYRENHQI